MADMPADEPMPDAPADMIMHAALTFDGHLLMASDDPSDDFGGVQGMSVNYSLTDATDARRVFDALADGGEVTMPLSEVFWSPLFGMCVDRFGIPWMVNVEAADAPS